MIVPGATTTDPTLLDRVGDWRDHEAWVDFVRRYEPWIRLCSRRFRLGDEGTEELCQRVWIELARRIRTYRYDPGKSFRGWLRRLCESRAVDLLRKNRSDFAESLDDRPAAAALDDEGEEPGRSALLERAEVVQDRVRRRVDERTWRIFWSIAIDGQSVREVAEAAGMTYYAAFAAQKRVGRMLREEGRRLLGGEDDRPRVGRNVTD